MKKKNCSRTRKPNAILYYTVCFFAKYYYRLVYGHSVERNGLEGIKPPYLVVAGHSGWLDYLITGVSMFPVRMNYVAAYNFFRSRVYKVLFSITGVIPKFQFTNDINAVKQMKGVIDGGGVVAIFPNGCLSNDGRPGGFAVFGIAKLAKFLNVPVVAIKTDGGYLTRPRWTKKARFGKIETTVSRVLTKDEINTMHEGEIYARILKATYFDDYEWQRRKMVPFKSRHPAEGVEYVLYKCPACRSEFTLRSKGDRLFCSECGNAVRMSKYGFFEPETSDMVHFDGIDKWFDFQKESIEDEIQSELFSLEAQTELKTAEPGKYGYQHLGFGVVSLNREEIVYSGTINGEQKRMVFPMKNIPMVPYAAGEYIEIARGSEISRFVFEDLRQQIKWVMAIRQIRDKFYERDRLYEK